MASDDEILAKVESITRKYIKKNPVGGQDISDYCKKLYDQVSEFLIDKGVKEGTGVYIQASKLVDSIVQGETSNMETDS